MPISVSVFIIVGSIIAAFIIGRKTEAREREFALVNAWFASLTMTSPPQPLTPEQIAVIRSAMEDDRYLWCYLNGSDSTVDHEPYYQQVIKHSRYLRTFGVETNPVVHYGIFEIGNELVFQVWIEFRYLNDTRWVLSGTDPRLRIVRLSDFRINYPDIAYGNFIPFIS